MESIKDKLTSICYTLCNKKHNKNLSINNKDKEEAKEQQEIVNRVEKSTSSKDKNKNKNKYDNVLITNKYCIYNNNPEVKLPIRGWFKQCFSCGNVTGKTIEYLYYDKLYLIYTCPKCIYKIENTDKLVDIEYNNEKLKCQFKELYKLNILYIIHNENLEYDSDSSSSSTPNYKSNKKIKTNKKIYPELNKKIRDLTPILPKILHKKDRYDFLTTCRTETTIIPLSETQF